MVDPRSAPFAAMVDAVLAQLDLPATDYPWRIVPVPGVMFGANVGVDVNGGRVYFEAATVDEAAVAFADRMQDEAIDIHWRGVPECLAGHNHPPRPELVNGRAVWLCPRTGETVRPIVGG